MQSVDELLFYHLHLLQNFSISSMFSREPLPLQSYGTFLQTRILPPFNGTWTVLRPSPRPTVTTFLLKKLNLISYDFSVSFSRLSLSLFYFYLQRLIWILISVLILVLPSYFKYSYSLFIWLSLDRQNLLASFMTKTFLVSLLRHNPYYFTPKSSPSLPFIQRKNSLLDTKKGGKLGWVWPWPKSLYSSTGHF